MKIREEYFYSLIVLFVPFRSECALVGDGESAEAAFNRHIRDNKDLFVHHDKLQAMLQAQSKVKEINEAGEKQEELCDPQAEEDALVRGEPKDALEDVFLLNEQPLLEVTLQNRIAMLNSDQLRVFNNIADLMKHQRKHENGACSCGKLRPLHMFLSGVGALVNHS